MSNGLKTALGVQADLEKVLKPRITKYNKDCEALNNKVHDVNMAISDYQMSEGKKNYAAFSALRQHDKISEKLRSDIKALATEKKRLRDEDASIMSVYRSKGVEPEDKRDSTGGIGRGREYWYMCDKKIDNYAQTYL